MVSVSVRVSGTTRVCTCLYVDLTTSSDASCVGVTSLG